MLSALVTAVAVAVTQPPSQLLFNFTRTRQPSPYLQLSELRLFDADGTAVPVASVESPGGSWPNANQGPSQLADDAASTKFIYLAFADGSTLVVLTPGSSAVVASYELVTAGNPPRRDPTEWTVSGLDACGRWTVLDQRAPTIACCLSRQSSYGTFALAATGEADPNVCAPP